MKKLNEAQLLDKIVYKNQKGTVIGQMSNGDLIIQINSNGHVEQVKDNECTVIGNRMVTVKPDVQFKFDKQTQKVLFEQWIKCGIFMNNTPVKLNNCYVQYSDYLESKGSVNVVVEGNVTMMDKNNIKLLEDVNDFANLNNLVGGTIPDFENPIGGERRKVWVKLDSKQQAIGGADEVEVIDIKTNKMMSVPAELVEIIQEIKVNASDIL